MALQNPRKLPISSVLCYKDKLLVSLKGAANLDLYSLGGLPYPYITSLNLNSHVTCLDWGVKKDLVLACTESAIFIIKIEDR